MIAIDTSALVAILFEEPEREAFTRIILERQSVLLSTPTALETRMVVHGRRGARAVLVLENLLDLPIFQVVAPGDAELRAAYGAFIAYGRGSGHPAALNFGDLFSYALAKVRGVPLLFKGDDFAQTDVDVVWRPTG